MAFSGSLTNTKLTSQGDITKGADADVSTTLAHGLGVIPDFVIVTAKSGTEAAWKVTAIDATNVTLGASNTGGTAASVCRVVAGVLHSLIK